MAFVCVSVVMAVFQGRGFEAIVTGWNIIGDRLGIQSLTRGLATPYVETVPNGRIEQ
jgi:ribosomal protein S19